ncbi:hypothetical protein AHF37_09392 [Paragonimus kellicotti]|nr:hypothetical protein AHF37_09392 [Paragonimus kellicotti]
MLMEVADSAVVLSHVGSDCVISLPKRVQTVEERERTELFSIEVADLLCQSPRCRLPFNKFIPSYHHHFSRQCRVADYGFTKLVDLLEAVPSVVKIVEEHGEKYVTLVKQRHLRIVAEHLLSMLEAAPGKRILVSELLNVYMKHHGYALCLEDFHFSSIKELLSKLPRLVRIETTVNEDRATLKQGNPDEPTSNADCSDKLAGNGSDVSNSVDRNPTDGDPPSSDAEKVVISYVTNQDEEYVCLADRAQIKHLAHKVLLILLDVPTGTLPISMFAERFRCTFGDEPNVQLIYEELGDIVEFRNTSSQTCNEETSSICPNTGHSICNIENYKSDPCSPTKDCSIQLVVVKQSNLNAVSGYIALKPLIMFARELRELLRQNQGKLLLIQLCAAYQRRFGVPLRPQRYNYPSLATLLQAVDFVALMRGRGVRCTLVLCQDFLDARSQTMSTKATSVCSSGSNCYSLDKQSQLASLPNSNGVNLGQHGFSPRVQQQLDELVERLTYDNANPCSNNLLTLHGQSDGITTNQTVVSFPGTNGTVGSPAVTPVSYRSLSTHSSLQFPYFGNMAMHTDCAQYSGPMSTYLTSPNAQMPLFAGSIFANVSTSRLTEQDQYLSLGHANEHANSIRDLSESIPVSKQTTVNPVQRLVGAPSQGDIPMEQSVRPLESCNTVNQLMPSITNCGPSGMAVDLPNEQSKSTPEQRETIPRYTFLHPGTNLFSVERPSEKISSFPNSGVCTTFCEPVNSLACHNSGELSSVNLISSNGKEAVGALNLPHASSHLDSLSSDNARLNKQSSHPSVPYTTIPLSQEDAAGNFSLDGLLAELRLEEKQQQRLDRSACADPESDLKQNTRMLLDNLSYL